MTDTAKQIEIMERMPSQMVPASSNVLDPMTTITNALANGASIEMIEKLIGWTERLQATAARKAFDAALSEASMKMPVISKNRVVNFTSQKGTTHYKYEDLGEISRVARPILAEHGLSYRFETKVDQRIVFVTCIVSHRDGHFVANTLSAAVDESGSKNHIQAIGSASTYLQRMTLKAALGLAASDEDDDGKAAGMSAQITDDQVSQIMTELAETSSNLELFLKRFKIEALPDLPASKFKDALAQIDAKRNR